MIKHSYCMHLHNIYNEYYNHSGYNELPISAGPTMNIRLLSTNQIFCHICIDLPAIIQE
jgi:hypothetical protein